MRRVLKSAVIATSLLAVVGQYSYAQAEQPVVVELFTSQSCSSCPPAEENLRELAKRDHILALEWHVDYWDDLRHGSAGKWKDPFSSPKHTQRQYVYNHNIRQSNRAYTPQIVINGQTELVGSYTRKINKHIANARASQSYDVISRIENDEIVFTIESVAPQTVEADALLVLFHPTANTKIRGGENKGLRVEEANVVVEAIPLGNVGKQTAEKRYRLQDSELSCALLIQEKNQGRILGAQYCPA